MAWGDFSFPSSFRVPNVPRPGTILRASQKSVSSALDTVIDTWNRCPPVRGPLISPQSQPQALMKPEPAVVSSKVLMYKLVPLLALVFLGAAVTAEAQYPGRYPPGGGQYPPGQYPPGQGRTGGGGTGIPVPWGRKSKDKKKQETKAPTFSAEGQTASNDGKQLLIHTKDGREITLALTAQTKFVKGDASLEANKIAPRTTVHVDASEDDEGNLTAQKVELLKD